MTSHRHELVGRDSRGGGFRHYACRVPACDYETDGRKTRDVDALEIENATLRDLLGKIASSVHWELGWAPVASGVSAEIRLDPETWAALRTWSASEKP